MTTIICCLGNPGDEYIKTRHNIGFRIGDYLANHFSFEKLKKKFNAKGFEGIVSGQKVMIIEPQTYMNNSGESVSHALHYLSASVSDLIVIYDDIDLPFSDLRFRLKGGAGTHNGMKSIISHIKSKDFARLRVGVGPVPERWDLSSFVLSKFTADEESVIPSLFSRSARFFEDYFAKNPDAIKTLHTKEVTQ